MYVITEEQKPKKISRSEKTRIVRAIKKYKSVDEIISYVFSVLEIEEITADDRVLHSAFFKLKEKHSDLLAEMTFTCRQIFPYSADLQRAVFNLQRSELMEAPNPSYDFHVMKKKDKTIVRASLLKSFSQKERQELAQMARELKELIEHRIGNTGK